MTRSGVTSGCSVATSMLIPPVESVTRSQGARIGGEDGTVRLENTFAMLVESAQRVDDRFAKTTFLLREQRNNQLCSTT